MEKPLEILDLPESVRRLVAECEVTGKRTIFARDGRSIAMMLSYDEYLALKETLEISRDAKLRAAIEESEAEVQRGQLLTVEDVE